MKVLFLTHSFPREEGDAAGSFLLRLASALRDEDITVEVVAPGAPGLEAHAELDGVAIDRFRYAPRRYERLAYSGTMAEQVRDSWASRLVMIGFLGAEFGAAVAARRRFEPDLVHAHWWFPNGLVGTWIEGIAEVPLVTTLHGTDVRLARDVAMARPLFRRVLKQSAAVTAVSHWLAREAERVMPSASPSVAPMPVDTSLFQPGGQRERDHLLFVGRLNQQKGLEHLLRGLALATSRPRLSVIGDGDRATELKRLATELGIADRVRWLGALRQPELVPHYQRATAVVIPSIDEGLGLVAVEAQLCEAPVVATDSGGLRDVVRHDETGLLVPPGDPLALAFAIDELGRGTERLREIAQAGRMQALASFAPESAARRYAQVYREARSERAA